jgi:hypothetical protein
MPKNFNKSTKACSRFSTLISGSEPSSSSKRSSSDKLTISSKRRKGKAPERATKVNSSSSVEKGPEIPIDHSHLEDFSQKLDIIFKQNSKIIKKIDKLINTQDNLEERVINLEERIEDMNQSSSRANDKPFINVI